MATKVVLVGELGNCQKLQEILKEEMIEVDRCVQLEDLQKGKILAWEIVIIVDSGGDDPVALVKSVKAMFSWDEEETDKPCLIYYLVPITDETIFDLWAEGLTSVLAHPSVSELGGYIRNIIRSR